MCFRHFIWVPRWDAPLSSVTFPNPNHVLCMSTVGRMGDETQGFLLVQLQCVCICVFVYVCVGTRDPCSLAGTRTGRGVLAYLVPVTLSNVVVGI